MDATILGSGSPIPLCSRGGQSLVVTVDGEPILVDCGPLTVERLLEHDFRLSEIETVLFTHQHVDHNASFFQFAVNSWMYGREALTIYGPDGTEALVDALNAIYEEDWNYREEFGRTIDCATDIDVVRTTGDLTVETDAWTLSACRVDHSIETYAYRIDEHGTDTSFVYVADTTKIDSLPAFAADADVLVYAAAASPPLDSAKTDSPGDQNSWRQYREANPEPTENPPFIGNHSTPEEAAEVAEAAGVDRLVVTHHIPARDRSAARVAASEAFSGELDFADDGFFVSF